MSGQMRFLVKRLFSFILDLSFVLKFNGFQNVLWISCGELILSHISLTCLASWLVYDFFAVFYFGIYLAFLFFHGRMCIEGCHYDISYQNAKSLELDKSP